MKHLSILSLFALHFSLFTHSAALPENWDVDLAAQPPQVFTLQRPRGETYELEAVLKMRGKPFEPAITNACIYWQTNGMENLYWSAPASVSNNVLRATWLPSMDPGSTTVRGYIGDPGHIYAAAFQFRFIASPGATQNELPLPQKVIDFSKVTVLNPPWPGGSARQLPPFLHYLEFDDTYPDAAAEWYAQADYSHGSCSAVRDGNTLSRNYDWNFNFMPEFVIRTVAASATGAGQHARFASLAVCNVGTNLTESDVTSGKWSKWYKALPGHAVDGINENCVVCEVNVVSGIPHDYWDNPTGDIHPLAAVRWALDNGTSAEMVATNLAARIMWPAGWRQNFHWMIADATSTYIVENGTYSNVTGRAVMTNFQIIDRVDGMGLERWNLLDGGANITNAWFTRAYRRETNPPWMSDLKDVLAYTNEIFDAWASHPKEYFRNRTNGGEPWWQTVHTSVYNISNKTLRVAVQETDDWYVFAVDQANVDLSPIEAQIAALQDGKRDLMNMDVYWEIENTDWTWTSENSYLESALNSGGIKPIYTDQGYWYVSSAPDTRGEEWYDISISTEQPSTLVLTVEFESTLLEHATATSTRSSYKRFLPTGGKIATRSETSSSALAKFDADGNLVSATAGTDFVAPVEGKGLSSNDYTDADKAEVAKVKDKADEFTEWDLSGLSAFGIYDGVLKFYPADEYPVGDWGLAYTKDGVRHEAYKEFSRSYVTVLTDFTENGEPTLEGFTATRKRVLRTGDAVTPQELTNAISTNNPAFVSAVRDTPTSGMPEDMPSDWGTYGTVGAALAALAAFVKWAKAKIVAVIDNDGNPTDQFATDLLGKQVAINALHYALYSVPTTGEDANKLKDRAVNAFTFSGGSLPTFPAQVAGYARDFLLNVTATADGSNITIPEPDGSTATSIGDALAFTAGKTYLVAITEIAAKHYYIRVIDTTPANAA